MTTYMKVRNIFFLVNVFSRIHSFLISQGTVRIIYKAFELDGNLTVIDWVMAESDYINTLQNNKKIFKPKSVGEREG